jgi:hypothetical protein
MASDFPTLSMYTGEKIIFSSGEKFVSKNKNKLPSHVLSFLPFTNKSVVKGNFLQFFCFVNSVQ